MPSLSFVLRSLVMVSYCLCAAVEVLHRQSRAFVRIYLIDFDWFNISPGSCARSSDFHTNAE